MFLIEDVYNLIPAFDRSAIKRAFLSRLPYNATQRGTGALTTLLPNEKSLVKDASRRTEKLNIQQQAKRWDSQQSRSVLHCLKETINSLLKNMFRF